MKSNKSLKTACDQLWRGLVKILAGFKCQKCGKTGTESHHVFGRIAESVRWHLMNGVCLCTECHKYAHSHVTDFKKWYEGIIGKKAYQSLKMRYYAPLKQDIETVYNDLKEETGKHIC